MTQHRETPCDPVPGPTDRIPRKTSRSGDSHPRRVRKSGAARSRSARPLRDPRRGQTDLRRRIPQHQRQSVPDNRGHVLLGPLSGPSGRDPSRIKVHREILDRTAPQGCAVADARRRDDRRASDHRAGRKTRHAILRKRAQHARHSAAVARRRPRPALVCPALRHPPDCASRHLARRRTLSPQPVRRARRQDAGAASPPTVAGPKPSHGAAGTQCEQ